MHTSILLPVFALVVLTAIVLFAMYRERTAEMKRRAIELEAMTTSTHMNRLLEKTTGADNFKNLFELPVLFYVLCILLAGGDVVSGFFVVSAWLYVVLRYIHSFIHLTYNRVAHRFAVYMASVLVLFAMWGVYGVRLIRAAMIDS